MKRNISKALAILMTLALIMTLAAVTAFAYTAIPGGTTSDLFKKYLTVDADAQIPNASFEFAIDAGTAVPGGDGNALEILAGPVVKDGDTVTAPAVAPATFTSGMDTDPGDATDETDTTKKFATSNIVFDFTGVTFSAPGVYRYVVTEKATDFEGVTIDNGTRYLDVFVFPSESDPTVLEVTTYALRNATDGFERVEDPENPGEYLYQYTSNPTKKTDGFYNRLDTVDLQFSKKIEGNQADMTKRFAYTLELSDVNPGTYTLTFTGDAAAIIGDNTSVVPGTDGVYTIEIPATGDNARSYTGTFYLTNGDVVTVNKLNTGYNYKVTEEAEDYQPTVGVDNDGTDNDFLDPYEGTGITAPITKTGWTNTREGAIPTGVILTVAPFMIGLLLFGAVMMFMISRRRRATY